MNQNMEIESTSKLAGMSLRDLDPAPYLGARPKFNWLSKDELWVDDKYQRRIATSRGRDLVKKIVKEFSWSKFQPITVTPRGNGHAVIDGQHRAMAAIMHPGVLEVPCWIVEAPDVHAQAEVFIGVNRDRNLIQPLQLHKAQLAAEEPEALHVDAVCREAGVTLAYNLQGAGTLPPRQTQAVSTIRKLLSMYGDAPVRQALKTLVDAYPDTPNQLRGQTIMAVTALYFRYPDRIDQERLTKILGERNCEDLTEGARAIKKTMGGSTHASLVEALVRAYDRGLLPHRRLHKAAA